MLAKSYLEQRLHPPEPRESIPLKIILSLPLPPAVYLFVEQMDHALERNASHTSLAIWTLKSVFYSLDPQNNKIIRLDSILAHLANAHLLEETLASECIRSKLLEVSHAPSSQDRDAMGGDKGSDRRFSGEFSPHVCHLLAPQVGLCQLGRGCTSHGNYPHVNTRHLPWCLM